MNQLDIIPKAESQDYNCDIQIAVFKLHQIAVFKVHQLWYSNCVNAQPAKELGAQL